MSSREACIQPATFDTSRLIFSSAEHRYWLDARRDENELRSVTTCIKEACEGTVGEEFWTEEARLRGTYLHDAILYHAEGGFGPGGLDESTLHEIVKPYFDGYLQFLEDERPLILHAEQRIYDEVFYYAGTFDLLVILQGPNRAVQRPGQPVVLDLIDAKSGVIPWWVGLQTAGYKRRIKPVYPGLIIRPWALQLKRTGTYYLEPVWQWKDARLHERQFLSTVDVAHLKRMHR